jgi:hypothetical protein
MNLLLPLSRRRAIVAVDIERSSDRTDQVKAELRDALYSLLDNALLFGGLTERNRDAYMDRGDGVLVLAYMTEATDWTVLIQAVIPRLAELLADHNARFPAWGFRLRAVVHVGVVHYDRHGCFGESLDLAFRLLNARKVKRVLRGGRSSLVLVVSEEIYSMVTSVAFQQRLRLDVGANRHHGWIRLYHPTASSSEVNQQAALPRDPDVFGLRLRGVTSGQPVRRPDLITTSVSGSPCRLPYDRRRRASDTVRASLTYLGRN